MVRANVLLPQPLSPIRPRVSPRRIWKLTPFTARTRCSALPEKARMSPRRKS